MTSSGKSSNRATIACALVLKFFAAKTYVNTLEVGYSQVINLLKYHSLFASEYSSFKMMMTDFDESMDAIRKAAEYPST